MLVELKLKHLTGKQIIYTQKKKMIRWIYLTLGISQLVRHSIRWYCYIHVKPIVVFLLLKHLFFMLADPQPKHMVYFTTVVTPKNTNIPETLLNTNIKEH